MKAILRMCRGQKNLVRCRGEFVRLQFGVMGQNRYKACETGTIADMSVNGSGIRDTARVLKTNKNTVISTLKKSSSIVQVNPNFQALNPAGNLAVRLKLACEEAEMDEQWSFVGNKSNQRWLWHAVDHATNTVPAYVFGKRKDETFK